MSPFFAEFLGTALLVLFGNGVVANVVLARTKGNNAGWVVITAGWGVAVFVAAFCSAPFSGAHLNPAVTLAMAIAGRLPIAQVVPYVAAHMLGAFIGAVLVYLFLHLTDHVANDPHALSVEPRCSFGPESGVAVALRSSRAFRT